MIGYLSGKVMDIYPGGVLLENNGVGYEISLSSSAFERLTREMGGGVYTYLQVREDGLSLFGFDNQAEKNMFLKLISVSGVGAKMGITILSGMSLKDLALAIATSDVKALSRIKGLGKKSAERIIVELRESVSSIGDSGADCPLLASTTHTSEAENAVMALISLGYTRSVAVKAVNGAMSAGANAVEEIIAIALRSLA